MACLLLAAPIVEGRIGEPGGLGASGAQVTLAQGPGERTQVRRTGGDGAFRFHALVGTATLTVVPPAGWRLEGPSSRELRPLGDRTERADFVAHPVRTLRGKLLVRWGDELAPVAGAAIGNAQTDAQGSFALDGLPAGHVEVTTDLLPPVSIETPPGPAELSRDLVVPAPAIKGRASAGEVIELAGLRLRVLPQAPALRPIADWAQGRPMSDAEIGSIERLSALANLDASFRLLVVAAPRPGELGRALQAALTLQRYLAGPGLVPRERLLFALGDVASTGLLALILTRVETPGEK